MIYITHSPIDGQLVWTSWLELYSAMQRHDWDGVVTGYVTADNPTLAGSVTATYKGGNLVEIVKDNLTLKGDS